MSLRTRVHLVVATLVVVPFLAAAAVISIYVSDAAGLGVRSELRAAAAAVTAEVSARCRTVGLAARALGLEASRRASAPALAAVVPGYADYAAVLGPDGDVLARSGELPEGAAPTGSPTGCSAGVADGAVLSERVGVSGAPDVTAAVVADVVDEADLTRPLGPGSRATVALVRDGEVLVQVGGLDPAAVRAAASAVPGTGTGELGDRVVEVAAGDGVPWRVVAVADRPGVAPPAAVVAIGLGALALALALGLYVARTLTRPLGTLTAAAERVAGGDLGEQLPVATEDEVGRLSASFNRVTTELRRNMAELERSRDQMRTSLQRIGDALEHTHDVDGLLQVVLDTAVVSTGARGGAFYRAEGTSLGLVCAQGLEAAGWSPPARLAVGTGLLGSVAGTGAVVRGVIGDERLPAPVAGEPAEGRLLAMPLRHGGVHAVLAVYAAAEDPPFSADQERSLRALADQAGIALDNVRMHREAERLSVTDPLTGLRNFRYLSMELAREIERANRFQRPLAVLMLDLDHFKAVNDTYGHARGDAVLRELAARVSEVIREVDTLARYGGEEFVLVLPETAAEGAVMLAERVCAAVRREPFGGVDGEQPLRITASVGVAAFPQHGESAATLMRKADEALYEAKRGGRDQWRLAGE